MHPVPDVDHQILTESVAKKQGLCFVRVTSTSDAC